MTDLRALARALIAIVLVWAAGCNLAAAETQDGKRVALVIGNSAYQHTSALKNPVNDARDVIALLAGLGFQVTEGLDLDKAGLEAKVRAFSSELDGADTALFYYAGHGLQVDGINYLVPVDAKVSAEDDVDFELMPLRQLVKRMERKASTNLVFLDACRNNPITRSLAQNMGTRSAAVGRGLARVDTGVGTLVSFATQPGNVALDGEGRNSPFTQAILKHLPTPGLDVALMMRRVRRDVLEATGGKQVPWTNSSLTDGFYFLPGDASKTVASVPDTTSSRFEEISTAYRSAQDVGTCTAYEAFEKAYPDSMYATLSSEWRKRNCGPSDPRELALDLQKELKRVGCDPGALDGAWGGKSRRALITFTRHAKLQIPTQEPTSEALAAVRQRTARVCPERKEEPVRAETKQPSAKNTTEAFVADEGRGTTFQKVKSACMGGSLNACNLGCRAGYKIACDYARYLRTGQ